MIIKKGESEMKKLQSFSIKIVIILLFWGTLYWINREAVQVVMEQSQLSASQRSVAIARILLGGGGIPNLETNPTSIGTTQSQFKEPRELNQAVFGHPNYQKAYQVASQFNQQLDVGALNQHFTNIINQKRSQVNWESIYVGEHLADGVLERAKQLSEYYYMGTQVVSGGDFRSLFAIAGAEHRLGENLYELYISAGDIHLSTWENPEILANYLFKAFEASIMSEPYRDFSSEYISIQASATDYYVDTNAYVRLVVVLVMDTE